MITTSVMKELRRPGRLLNVFCTFNLPPLYRMYKKIQTRYYPQFLSTLCSEYIENKKICRVSFSPWMFHRWHRYGYVLLLLLLLLMMMMLLLLLLLFFFCYDISRILHLVWKEKRYIKGLKFSFFDLTHCEPWNGNWNWSY